MQCSIEKTLASMKLLFSGCWWNVIICFVMKKIFLFFNKKWMGMSIKRMRYHYVTSKKMKASTMMGAIWHYLLTWNRFFICFKWKSVVRVSIKWLNYNRNINFNDSKNSKFLVILIKNTDHWKELFFHYLKELQSHSDSLNFFHITTTLLTI